MGRILETFRQPGQLARANALPATDVLPEVADGEETPFIEIGPRRSFEASPAVLASIPSLRPGVPIVRETPKAAPAVESSDAGAKVLPRPHNVLFRSMVTPSRFAPELVAFHTPSQPDSACYAELLEAVRGAVESRTKDRPAVLLLTAIRPDVGATTVLLNVAITAARQGSRVVVVDANLRRPAVAERLGLEPAPGLTEVLAGEVALAQALRTTEQENLTVLTAGAPAPTLASTEALRSLLAELRGQFDLVLVDGPRWDGRPGVTALAAACDALFLVVPREEIDQPPANDLVSWFQKEGDCLAGCILTEPT